MSNTLLFWLSWRSCPFVFAPRTTCLNLTCFNTVSRNHLNLYLINMVTNTKKHQKLIYKCVKEQINEWKEAAKNDYPFHLQDSVLNAMAFSKYKYLTCSWACYNLNIYVSNKIYPLRMKNEHPCKYLGQCFWKQNTRLSNQFCTMVTFSEIYAPIR